MKSLKATAILSVAAVAAACSHVPSDIIQPHKMALLMADIHTGEAVVDHSHREFASDSVKQAFKQSIYMRHGVTSEQVDSSFAWYGRNITYYMDVYDETIEILEHRLIESGNRVAAANALSIAGDSVDVWPNARFITISDRMPSRIITFSFDSDQNWEKGDMYTWRAKFFHSSEESLWLIGAEYADGTVESINTTVSGDGWKDIKLQTDSTLQPVRVLGYLSVVPKPGTQVRLDSIEMVRKRSNPDDYRRPYAIKYDKLYKHAQAENDTTYATEND